MIDAPEYCVGDQAKLLEYTHFVAGESNQPVPAWVLNLSDNGSVAREKQSWLISPIADRKTLTVTFMWIRVASTAILAVG
jgi:hypothetical protein